MRAMRLVVCTVTHRRLSSSYILLTVLPIHQKQISLYFDQNNGRGEYSHEAMTKSQHKTHKLTLKSVVFQ